jgi:predicted DNA-binding transcriptional regulator AlpA
VERSTEPRPATPDELIGIAELRAVLGVGKARAYTITRDRSFPAPWYEGQDGQTRLWLRVDVETWLNTHRPGWRDAPPAG